MADLVAEETVRVGLLGCGHVGSALVRLLQDNAELIEQRAGVHLEVTRVAVRDLGRDRDVPLPKNRFTEDGEAVVTDPDIDIVVEVIGGIEPARSLITEALKSGKPVVTANKELLANAGRELFETAEGSGVDLLFEASVAGGIPLIRPLRESLAGDRIRRVTGIVNGTTNYILTRMTEAGSSFDDALAEAQKLGYAERDPTADIEGYDAAAKAAIIASIAFGARVVAGDVYREGIAEISDQDISSAHDLGYVVKLLAVAEGQDGEVAVRVHPAMIPVQHPLASVRESFNALVHRGRRGRRADALRARRRWRALGVRGARRPHRRGEEPRVRREGCDDRDADASNASGPSTSSSRSSTCSWKSPTGRVSWPRSPTSSASTMCRSSRCSNAGSAPTPASSS